MKNYDVLLEEIYSEGVLDFLDLKQNKYISNYKKLINYIKSSTQETTKKILSKSFKGLNADQKNLKLSQIINNLLGTAGYGISNLQQELKDKPIFLNDDNIDYNNAQALLDLIIKKITQEDNKIIDVSTENHDDILKKFKYNFYYSENTDTNESSAINSDSLDEVIEKASSKAESLKESGKKIKSYKLRILLTGIIAIFMAIFLNYSISAKGKQATSPIKNNIPKIEKSETSPEYNITLNKIKQNIEDSQSSLKSKKEIYDQVDKELKELNKEKTEKQEENERIKEIILDHEADALGLTDDEAIDFINVFKNLNIKDWKTSDYKKFIDSLKKNGITLKDVSKAMKYSSIKKAIKPNVDSKVFNEFISNIKISIKDEAKAAERKIKQRERTLKQFMGKLPPKVKAAQEEEDNKESQLKQKNENSKKERDSWFNKFINKHKYGSDVDTLKEKYQEYEDSINNINEQIENILEKKNGLGKEISDIKKEIQKYKESIESLKSNVDLLNDSQELSQQDVTHELEAVAKSTLARSSFKYQEQIQDQQQLLDTTLRSLSEKVHDKIIKEEPNFEKLKTLEQNKIILDFLNKNQSDPNIKKGLDGVNLLQQKIKDLYENSEKFYNKEITPEDLQLAKKMFIMDQASILDKNSPDYLYNIQYDIDENGDFFVENNDDFKRLESDFDDFINGNKKIVKELNNTLSRLKTHKKDFAKKIKKIDDLENQKIKSATPEKIEKEIQEIEKDLGDDFINDFYNIDTILKGKYKFGNINDTLLFLKIVDFEKHTDNSEIDKLLQSKVKDKKAEEVTPSKETKKQRDTKPIEDETSKETPKEESKKTTSPIDVNTVETKKEKKEDKKQKSYQPTKNISLNEKQQKEMKALGIEDEKDYLSLVKIKPNLENWNKNDYLHFVQKMKENKIKIIEILKVINNDDIKRYLNHTLWDLQDGDDFKISDQSASNFKKLIQDKSKDTKKEMPSKDKKVKTSSDFMKKVGIDANEFKSLQKIAKSFTEKNWTIGEYKDFVKSLKNNDIKLSDVANKIGDSEISDNVNSNLWIQKDDGKWKIDNNKIKDFKDLMSKKMMGESLDLNLLKILKKNNFLK